MSPRQTFWGWMSLLAATAMFALVSAPRAGHTGPLPNSRSKPVTLVAQAEPDAKTDAESPVLELLPIDPVLFFGVTGEAANREAFEQTAMYAALYETGLMDSIETMFREALPQDQMPPEAKFIEQLGKTVQQEGLYFTLALPQDAVGPAIPWGMLVLPGAAKYEPQIAKLVQKVMPKNGDVEMQESERAGLDIVSLRTRQFPPADLSWWTEGETLVVVAGINATDQALPEGEGSRGTLTGSRLWKDQVAAWYAESEGDERTLNSIGWLDVAQVAAATGPISVPTRDDRRVTVAQIIKAAGLDGLKSVVARGGFDGPAIWNELRVETDGNPKGLLALGGKETFTLDDLPPLPASMSGISVLSIDFAATATALVNTAERLVELAPPREANEFRENLARIPEVLGFDPIPDLLEPLGNVLTVYLDEGQGPLGFALTVVISVDDAAEVRSTLNGLLRRLQRQVDAKDVHVLRYDQLGEKVVSLEIGRGVFNPTFVVTDDWLAISLVPQGIELFLLRANGDLPSWEPDEEISELLDGLPEELTGLSIADPRPFVKLLAGLGTVALPVVRGVIANEQKLSPPFEISAADLPPAELIAEPLFPNIAYGYEDGNTYVWYSRSSIPAGGSNGAVGGVAVGAVLVALILPAVQQAREAARRMQSQNNLKQIGLAIHNYYDTFNKMPQGTVPAEGLEPEERVSWLVSILPFIEQQALYQAFDQKKAWDSEANEQPASTRVPVYINPSNWTLELENGYAPTHYVGWAGLGKDGPTLPVTSPKAGMFGYNRATKFTDVHDGLSNTVMVSDATVDSVGPYAAGGASTIRPLTKQPYINGPDGIGSPHSRGMNVLFADGSVRFISENADPKVVEAMMTIRGGEVVPID